MIDRGTIDSVSRYHLLFFVSRYPVTLVAHFIKSDRTGMSFRDTKFYSKTIAATKCHRCVIDVSLHIVSVGRVTRDKILVKMYVGNIREIIDRTSIVIYIRLRFILSQFLY